MDIRVLVLIRSHQLDGAGSSAATAATWNIKRSVDTFEKAHSWVGPPSRVDCKVQNKGGWQSQSAEAELAETDRASDSAPGE